MDEREVLERQILGLIGRYIKSRVKNKMEEVAIARYYNNVDQEKIRLQTEALARAASATLSAGIDVTIDKAIDQALVPFIEDQGEE